jgi:hypothetical protein
MAKVEGSNPFIRFIRRPRNLDEWLSVALLALYVRSSALTARADSRIGVGNTAGAPAARA